MKLSGVGRRFANRWVLRDVTQDVPRRLLVTGPNGSGKSTLLRIMAGVLRSHAGQATIGAHACHELAAKRQVAWVGQEPAGYESFTVKEHMQWVARMRKVPFDMQSIQDAGLDPNVLVGSLSRGQLQRMSLAQAVHSTAPYLLLDEPFNHLDRQAKTWLSAHLEAYPGTVVVASHEPLDWPTLALEAP